MHTVMCQRWTRGRVSWQAADPSERFDARRYEVHPIDEATAKAYVLAHHYLGTYPAASRRFGLYRAGGLVGVAVYSVPVQVRVLTNALPGCEPYRESLELGRFLLADPEPGNAESWFIARCHEVLAAAGLRGVVSFSDPLRRVTADGTVVAPGHVGYIYQATNAIYTGCGKPGIITVLPDGLVLSDRSAAKIRRRDQGHEYAERILTDRGARPMRVGECPSAWLRAAVEEAGGRRIRHPGCHRYVFQLGRNRRARERVRVGLPSLAYPKQIG
jgi:hypothetical protein